MKSRSSWVAIMFANLAYINAQLTHAHTLMVPWRYCSIQAEFLKFTEQRHCLCSHWLRTGFGCGGFCLLYDKLALQIKSGIRTLLSREQWARVPSFSLTHTHAFICRAYAVLGTRAQRTCNCYVTVGWALLLHTPENCKQKLVKSCQVALEW